jgi:TatD DNase family protein
MKNIFVDTHAHLNFPEFAKNYREVIERAKKAGVRTIICASADIKTSKRAIEIANEYPKGIYAAVGIHPIHADQNNFQELKKLTKDKKVVAIGETGLDYKEIQNAKVKMQNDKEKLKNNQKELFESHLEIAKKIGKPLIFHCRDGRSDFVKIIKKYAGDFKSGRMRGVMHCFPGNWDFAREILDLGMMISYTGLITFTKREDQLEAVKKIPLERLMIETDCPFMAPEPYRGQRNEPAYVLEIAKKIAELKNISVDKVAETTTKNAMEFFGVALS